MQKQGHTMERRANSLIALATHGTDKEVVKALKDIQSEELKTLATYINKDGNTLLHVTAVKERMESLMALVKLSMDINSKNGSGRSALYKCINQNTLNSARLLLQAGANVNEIVCRQMSETLLHRTVKSNRFKALELLLEMGADTDAKTRDGETPLHYTARYNRLLTAQVLIRAGADSNATNKDGETALHVAIATKSFDLAKLLIQQKKSNMALKDRRGMTPLHAAVADGCVDLVKIMLSSNSATINSKESLLGRTPLLLACSTGTQRMASLLLSHGADANLTTNYRKSVLHVAASNGNVEVLGAVIKFVSNPNALSINNMTPLHYAVKGEYSEIVKILLKAGVNVNMKDIEGNTSLHIASAAGDNESVMALLKHSAHANATNMKQQSPLHLAFINGHKDTGSILISHGTDPAILDMHDKTAMDYWEEYMKHQMKHDIGDKQSIGVVNGSLSSIEEEETLPLLLGRENIATAKEIKGSGEDRLNEYVIDNVNVYQKDYVLSKNNESTNAKRKSMNGLVTNYHVPDGSLINGNIVYTEDGYVDHDNEIIENEDAAFLENGIENIDAEEELHECEDTEFQTESGHVGKHKKHLSRHRRVHKTTKSKKVPNTPRASKSKSKSQKSSSEDGSKGCGHGVADCQRTRKIGVTNAK